ncbi:hypothetical protein ACQKWADRAFT_300227 [Trichoderma austrokoningii]
MTYGSPTGGSEVSQDEHLAARLPNGKEATFINMAETILHQRLAGVERERRQCTPDVETPFQSAIRPMFAKQQCRGLWASLADVEMLDEARKGISSAWYQFYTALAMIQMLASKAEEEGAWNSSSVLFGDGSNSHEEPELSHSYWRDVTDSVCRILVEKMGTTKTEMRAHLQKKIELDVFWGVERDYLRPIAASEDDKYRDAMNETWGHTRLEPPSSPQPTTRRAISRQTAPQALETQQPGKVRKITARKGEKTRLGIQKSRAHLRTTTRGNEASRKAREVPGNSTDSGPVRGNSLASTAATVESSGIAHGLSPDDIIPIDEDNDNDKRSLRKQPNSKTNQSPASSQIIDGRVDTKRHLGRTK